MKFIISTTELKNKLEALAKVISSKNTLPILDNFLFVVEENELFVIASDLETTIKARVNVEDLQGYGQIAIDAKRLLDITRNLPEQPLIFSINTESFEVEIQSENGKFSVVGQGTEDYPAMPIVNDENGLAVNTAKFLYGIENTLFAAANDELRPVMSGIFVQASPNSLVFVASDAHRLAEISFEGEGITEKENAFIFPKKAATMIKWLFSKTDAVFEMFFDTKNVLIVFDNTELVFRLVEGIYPNYKSVLPSGQTNILKIERQALLNALKRVSVCANQASSLIKLQLSEKGLQVSAQDIDFSISANEKLQGEYTGETLEIGFNSRFFVDILGTIRAENIEMKFLDNSRAAIIEPVDETINDLFLLMPMMIS